MSDMTPAKSLLVLVLYTGGTVGMKKLSENGMIPINLQFFIDLIVLDVLHVTSLVKVKLIKISCIISNHEVCMA